MTAIKSPLLSDEERQLCLALTSLVFAPAKLQRTIPLEKRLPTGQRLSMIKNRLTVKKEQGA